MNSKAIGDDAEKKAQAILEDQGYTVCRAWRQYSRLPSGNAISLNADFFNCFDLIAIPGPMVANKSIRFIQVTAERSAWAKKQRKILDSFPEQWPMTTVIFEVWASMKKKMVKGMTRMEYNENLYFRCRQLSATTRDWKWDTREYFV